MKQQMQSGQDPQDPVLGYVDRIAYVVMATAMVAACALPIATAFAAEPLPVPGRSALLFNYLDADHNGVVTLAEARRIQGFEAAFHQADENRDGKLTRAEFASAQMIHASLAGPAHQYDSALNAQVKEALVRADAERAGAIQVETYDRQVILGGRIDSPARLRRMVEVAGSVPGVTAVKSSMEVQLPREAVPARDARDVSPFMTVGAQPKSKSGQLSRM